MKTTTKKLSMVLILGMAIVGVCRSATSRAASTPEYLLEEPGIDRPEALDDGWDCINELFDGNSCRVCVMEGDSKAAQDRIQSTVDMWQLNYYGNEARLPSGEPMLQVSPGSSAEDGAFCAVVKGAKILTLKKR